MRDNTPLAPEWNDTRVEELKLVIATTKGDIQRLRGEQLGTDDLNRRRAIDNSIQSFLSLIKAYRTELKELAD